MLRKLIKYELKATGRIFLPFYLSLLIVAVITKLIYPASPGYWDFPAFVSMLIYIMIMVGMFIMTLLVMIQRFYRNLLSDEGYLMFTLPTKTWKLIVSKLLVSILWIISSLIIAFLSIFIIIYKKGFIMGNWQILSEGFRFLKELMGTSVYTVSLEILFCAFISLIFGILLIYASLAIGHLFNKHKMLASFGAFIALNTISQFLLNLFIMTVGYLTLPQTPPSVQNISQMIVAIQLFFLCGILFAGILSTAYFTVTNYILSKKLNLE